jgi:hypothetical protein
MPRQVSDEEWDYLQARRQVADFVESIYNDPALGKEAKRLIKRKYPNVQIPDLDIEDKVEQRFASEKKERDDEAAKTKREKEDAEFKKQRAKTQAEHGFTDEAMARLEKMMVERNIGDYEVAASYMAAREPRTSESTYSDGFWNHAKADGFAEIAKDPEGYARGEIMKTLTGIQQRDRLGR